ncbi:hypothetical protein PSAC2689_40279 [Paraburkholderia sacchari]
MPICTKWQIFAAWRDAQRCLIQFNYFYCCTLFATFDSVLISPANSEAIHLSMGILTQDW